jgi:hypothetical protein
MLQTKKAVRKPFPINYVQVTLENIGEVATWCKGAVEKREQRMLGTTVELPVIKIKGQGDQRNKTFDATLGCYVVEFKGSFRIYKPAQFDASFDLVPDTEDLMAMAQDAVDFLKNEGRLEEARQAQGVVEELQAVMPVEPTSDLAGLAARENTDYDPFDSQFRTSGA